MSKVSRRSLARYAADQLQAGKSANSVAKNMAAELTESGRLNEVEFLLNDISAELESRGKLAVASVTSAYELTPQLREALASKIKKVADVEAVILDENIDKSVLGGVRIETSGRIWDHTIARKLLLLREIF